MFKWSILGSLLGCTWLILVIVAGSVIAQTPDAPDWDTRRQRSEEDACRAQVRPTNGEQSYSIRTVKWPLPLLKGYGVRGKRWYERLLGPIIPALRPPNDKYRDTDIRFIAGEYGRPVPLGESSRSVKIRRDTNRKLKEARQRSELQWQTWLAANPNATDGAIRTARSEIFAAAAGSADLPRFDWREMGINVGPVADQGFVCNTCWAFSTIDAMEISRRIDAYRAGRKSPAEMGELESGVPRLVSCMSRMKKPDQGIYCGLNWHGEAFSYMVDHGLPLGVGSVYSEYGWEGWKCDKRAAIKALTWDFVSATPQSIPTTEELKRDLITYGPVVATMNVDSCLILYGGGVFNEETAKDGPYHLVLIIGWDDEKKAWLVKNSFGEEWGEKGFGWIKYNSNNIGKWAAWIMADPKAEERRFRELSRKK
jgi:C1A family cysteine protease